VGNKQDSSLPRNRQVEIPKRVSSCSRLFRGTCAKAKRTGERVFYGRLWVDEASMRIVRVRGKALPEGNQRFPGFETDRKLKLTRCDAARILDHYSLRITKSSNQTRPKIGQGLDEHA
jgi:hypothetical protein